MTPKITFKNKGGKLLIKIVIHSQSDGLYDTGITIDTSSFSESQQLCGDPSVMTWMLSTSDSLLKLFRPGMSAKSLWATFIQNQSKSVATIQDAFDYYLANMPLADNTKTLYSYTMKAIQKAGMANTELSEITPALLRSFVKGLTSAEGSKFSALGHVKTIVSRYIFDHSLDIELNLNGIMKRPQYTRKENEWLSLEEVETLWNSPVKKSSKDARDLFCLCCWDGMSVIDALLFDPKKNIKEINGREFIVYNRTKTGSRCEIPIVSQLKEIIDSRQWPIKIKMRTCLYQIKSLGKQLIGKDLHSHQGRKSFGALFLEFGFSIEAVSKMLGHSNILISSKIYAPITSKKISNELERVAKGGLVVFSESL